MTFCDITRTRTRNTTTHWLANRTWEIGGHFLASVFAFCGLRVFLFILRVCNYVSDKAVNLIQRWPQVSLIWQELQQSDNQIMHTTLKICIHRSQFCPEVLISTEVHHDKGNMWTTFQEGRAFMDSSTTPCNGFYANLLGYQKSHYPSQTNREVGILLSKIDPNLAATVDIRTPENVKKIQQISSRKTWIHWWHIHQNILHPKMRNKGPV